MLDYQKGYTRRAADREQQVYTQLLATYEQLLFAADEGVFEITVRSQSGAITVPVDLAHGGQLTTDLVECFIGRIQRVERNLNATLVELGFETKKACKKKLERQQQLVAVGGQEGGQQL